MFLLGVDEIDIAPGAFVDLCRDNGDRGAMRADVVLPGAAYPEKSAIYVNTEGRVQMAPAPPSRPATRGKTGRSCGRCPTFSGKRLPYELPTALRQSLFKAHPHLISSARSRPPTPRKSIGSPRWAANGQAPFRSGVDDFYFTNPIARCSAVMAECSALAQSAPP